MAYSADLIPGLFVYLLLANRELVAPVVDTTLGRLVLLPAAALLEVAGVVLSWRAAMDLTLLGALAVGLAAFSLLMAVFAPWLAVPARDDVVRAAGLPRERYERLVSAERPAWERALAPVAGWIGRRVPALASQVSERDIVRAGLDPAALPPAEVSQRRSCRGVAAQLGPWSSRRRRAPRSTGRPHRDRRVDRPPAGRHRTGKDRAAVLGAAHRARPGREGLLPQ